MQGTNSANSSYMLADRICDNLIKYCAHLLYSGEVQCVDDMNVISIITLGLHPRSGGLLAIADSRYSNTNKM